MTAVCLDCASTSIQLDQPADDGWYSILVTLSDQVPAEDHCQAWLDSKGISDDAVEQVAIAMHASLRYDPKRGAWMYNGKPRYDIWRICQSWCLSDLRRNGRKPTAAVSKAPVHVAIGAITRGDDGLWAKALGAIQLKITRPSYETWLKDTVGLGLAGNTLVVGVPNEMVGEMLEMRMYSLIQQAVQDQAGSDVDVVFQICA